MCIFCDSKVRSLEHIFPSSFGGRLTNNKIYCQDHNSKLGFFVSVLDSQIGAINNLFGIRPDRGKAKSIKLENSDTGEIYTRDVDGNFSLSIMDNISTDEIMSGKPVNILASSTEDFHKFKQQFQEKHNVEIELLNKGEISREIMKKPLTIKILFGGKDFFKATLYLLVTFLAHYSKETLLKLNLNNIKELLLCNTDLSIFDIVQLENYPSFLNDDESQVEHSIAFVKDNNILYGIVSYFNVVTYTVKIGEYMGEFENFVVYIHPLDTSLNPNDSMKKEPLPFGLNVEFNPALHKDKIANIINGSNPIMSKLEEKSSRFENNRQNESLRNEIRNLESEGELLEFWMRNQQHIYNSILFIVNDSCEYINNSCEYINLIRPYLNMLIKEESLISNSIKSNLKLSNDSELFQPIIESLELSEFINRLCLDLAKKYAQKSIQEDENVFQQIRSAILSLSYNNLHTIRNFKRLNVF